MQGVFSGSVANVTNFHPGRSFFALLAASCAHQPGTFRLIAPAGAATLVPPGAKSAAVTRTAFRVSPIPRKTVCAASPHGLLIQRKWLTGPRAVVTRDAIGSTAGAELFEWAVELEKQGCIPPNQAFRLAENVIDALPLALTKRFQLLQGRSDLTSGNSLRVVSPIYKNGAPASAGEITGISPGTSPNSLTVDVKGSDSITGYEITWYDLLPRDIGPGYRVIPRSTEVHLGNAVEHPAAPATARFQADPQARWFQLFMMTKVSENDFDFVVLSARTPAQLEDEVAAFNRDSAAYLKAADPAVYTILPHGTGINSYIRVKVNGVSLDLPRGNTVLQAIGQSVADPRTVLPALRIKKLHDGKLYPVQWDRATGLILSLPLEGGETIDW